MNFRVPHDGRRIFPTVVNGQLNSVLLFWACSQKGNGILFNHPDGENVGIWRAFCPVVN